jgi:hypothetical protein
MLEPRPNFHFSLPRTANRSPRPSTPNPAVSDETTPPFHRAEARQDFWFGTLLGAALNFVPGLNLFIVPSPIVAAAFAARGSRKAGIPRPQTVWTAITSAFLALLLSQALFDLAWALLGLQLTVAANFHLLGSLAGAVFGETTASAFNASLSEQLQKRFNPASLPDQLAIVALEATLVGGLTAWIMSLPQKSKPFTV